MSARRRPSTGAPAPARAAAARTLVRVAGDDAYADLVLDAEIDARGLDPRDAALATELVYGTLRWQRYLDWILAPHSTRPLTTLDPRVLALLRMTAYQLVFLERVPAFAAVSDAVSLAKARSKHGVPEFVNAVLRSFARRGAAEREPRPPADRVEALALRLSFPTWLAARWVARYGDDDAAALMRAMNERPPLTIRANTLRVTREALAERLAREDGLTVTAAAYAPEALIVEHGGAPGAWRAFDEGGFAVQDEASMLIARLLAPEPGDTLVDACAAPGTKATHLAQLMGDRGRVIALDPQPARLARVPEAAARLGVSIVETRDGTVEAIAPEFRDAADGVLVDAPCTNLGVLRRNPEVKWRRVPQDVAASAARQRAILDAAAGMVKAGGRLVYATCSLEPEENEAVVADFLAAHGAFALDPPGAFPLPLDPDGVLRCRPDRHGTDGFTAVRLRRAR
ncbi:MAG: 16S rRNA (cytosine(967)-C(5))-methyltransferase RsmB [Candidatus Rokubacteria bacterium]|nr:16S rRNA (cytosine(967)-C(5))-methyltransferase RsmB [Candidatus Rokubacteria bacterium]